MAAKTHILMYSDLRESWQDEYGLADNSQITLLRYSLYLSIILTGLKVQRVSAQRKPRFSMSKLYVLLTK